MRPKLPRGIISALFRVLQEFTCTLQLHRGILCVYDNGACLGVTFVSLLWCLFRCTGSGVSSAVVVVVSHQLHWLWCLISCTGCGVSSAAVRASPLCDRRPPYRLCISIKVANVLIRSSTDVSPDCDVLKIKYIISDVYRPDITVPVDLALNTNLLTYCGMS